MIMKLFLFLSILLGLFPSVKADPVCVLTSETYTDVTIKLKKIKGLGKSIGTLDYKNKPSIGFDVGIWNGYGGQYYVARSYLPESLNEEKTYQERTKNTKK